MDKIVGGNRVKEGHLDFLMRRQNDLWHRNAVLDTRLRERQIEEGSKRLSTVIDQRDSQMEGIRLKRRLLADLIDKNRFNMEQKRQNMLEERARREAERKQAVYRNIVVAEFCRSAFHQRSNERRSGAVSRLREQSRQAALLREQEQRRLAFPYAEQLFSMTSTPNHNDASSGVSDRNSAAAFNATLR